MSDSPLEALRKANPDKQILTPHDKPFERMGHLIHLPDRSVLESWAEREVDPEGPVYIAHYRRWDGTETLKRLEQILYGSFPAEIGSCCGMNTKMNGMEYHKGNEILHALTPLVLILGHITDLKNLSWESSLAEFYYLEAGETIEMYSSTMHLAPCRIDEKPFKSLIVLPLGTNQSLNYPVPSEDPLLWMSNKWLLCHAESPAAHKGAVVGITGPNRELNPL